MAWKFAVYLSTGTHYVLDSPRTLEKFVIRNTDAGPVQSLRSDMGSSATAAVADTSLLWVAAGGISVATVVIDCGIKYQQNAIFSFVGGDCILYFS